jgi:hypothetical protein
MGEAEGDRNALISRIGTYFLLLGLLAIIIFIASDVSRSNTTRQFNATQTYQAQIPGLTQTYIVQGVQALQTRDAGALTAVKTGQPTPTLVTPRPPRTDAEGRADYLALICVGSLVLALGFAFKRMTAKPAQPTQRFQGLRKMQEKNREAKAKKEAAKKSPPKK